MAQIEFITDQKNEKQVLTLLNDLLHEAKNDQKKLHMLKLVQRGFEYLEKYGVDTGKAEMFAQLNLDDKPYTIRLVKELKHHPPLYEFRINWEEVGAFRAIFYIFMEEDEQILGFIRAMIKQETSSREFEDMIIECWNILNYIKAIQNKGE